MVKLAVFLICMALSISMSVQQDNGSESQQGQTELAQISGKLAQNFATANGRPEATVYVSEALGLIGDVMKTTALLTCPSVVQKRAFCRSSSINSGFSWCAIGTPGNQGRRKRSTNSDLMKRLLSLLRSDDGLQNDATDTAAAVQQQTDIQMGQQLELITQLAQALYVDANLPQAAENKVIIAIQAVLDVIALGCSSN